MKLFRLSVIAAGGLALLLVGTVIVAFNSSFQTWAGRKALSGQPGMKATLGSLSAGLRRVELRDLRVERDGAVLIVPSLSAEMSVLSAAANNISVSKLVAKGWTLDLSKPAATAPAATPDSGRAATAAGSTAPAGTAPAPVRAVNSAVDAFKGVFAALDLPVDVSIDGVQLEGDVILAGSAGRLKTTLSGGGLGARREAKFSFTAQATLTDTKINSAEVRGELVAAMDTSRTFTRLEAKLAAQVRGTPFPNGVSLQSSVAAGRGAHGETYAVSVANEGGEILAARADFPRGAQRLDGTWKVDVRDADLAPFALGLPLPAFTAVGEGRFDTDARFAAVHVLGRLNAAASRLEVIRPQLAALGELKVVAEFDVAEHDGTVSVQKLETALAGVDPVATVRTLQAFDFKPGTGELRATDATRELFGVVLHGVPLAWVKPFVPDVALEGEQVRGEFVATARGGGGSLRSTAPLRLEGLQLSQAGKPLLRGVDVSLNLAADYTPQGWQAELGGLTAKSGGMTLVSLDGRAGRLAGRNQPLKATGKLVASLPALLAQPVAQGTLLLTGGDMTVDFAASLAEKQELQARIALKNLLTVADNQPQPLPEISGDVRADISSDGKIAFNVPLLIQNSERKSDVTVVGSIGPEKDKARAVEALITSSRLVLDDAKIFAAVVPANVEQASTPAPGSTPPVSNAPPWAGLHGTLGLQIKTVVYSDTFEMNDVGGKLKMEAGMLKLEGVQAGLGSHGRASLSGTVTFNPDIPHPYGLAADMTVRDFDPGPLFQAIDATQPPTVEGKFDVTSKLEGRARTIGALALGAGGDFQLTSRGGVFRGLPVSLSHIVEKTSKWAELMASAGNMIGLSGRKESVDIANKAQAVAELGRGINPIPFDQLSVVLSRDAALNTTLKEFTLIAPELRISGSGTALHRADSSLFTDALAMEFKLRARGRTGDLLKYLGVLETEPDNLGYRACTVPFKVSGSLSKPDVTELSGRLASLTLDKSGVTDKASELFNRVFGGGK